MVALLVCLFSAVEMQSMTRDLTRRMSSKRRNSIANSTWDLEQRVFSQGPLYKWTPGTYVAPHTHNTIHSSIRHHGCSTPNLQQ
jgi:hypothetical protein